jgi:hypothetical protein
VPLECWEKEVLARHQSLKPLQHRAPLFHWCSDE